MTTENNLNPRLINLINLLEEDIKNSDKYSLETKLSAITELAQIQRSINEVDEYQPEIHERILFLSRRLGAG